MHPPNPIDPNTIPTHHKLEDTIVIGKQFLYADGVRIHIPEIAFYFPSVQPGESGKPSGDSKRARFEINLVVKGHLQPFVAKFRSAVECSAALDAMDAHFLGPDLSRRLRYHRRKTKQPARSP